MEHSNWGPSSAHRRIACRGSAEAESGVPEDESLDSCEGHMHHAVLEKVLRGQGNAFAHVLSEHPGPNGTTLEFTRDQARVVQEVVDRVQELHGRVYPEVKVDLSAWIPGQFGTSDIGIVLDGGPAGPRSLRIRDAKFGRGDVVLAERNPQCMLYAAGFWSSVLSEDPDIGSDFLRGLEAGDIPVILEVDQPYKANFDAWETDLSTCLRFAEEYAAIYRESQEGPQPRTPGPAQCLYCKGKVGCRPYTNYCMEVIGMTVDELESSPPGDLKAKLAEREENMTPEQRARLYLAKSLITKMLDSVEETLRADYMAGRDTGGLKLIPGASRRVWADEKKARDELVRRFKKEDVVKESLLSPAKVLQLAGPRQQKKLQELITRKENKPSLVPENHKAEGIARAIDHFDDLTDENPDLDLDLDDFDLDLEM